MFQQSLVESGRGARSKTTTLAFLLQFIAVSLVVIVPLLHITAPPQLRLISGALSFMAPPPPPVPIAGTAQAAHRGFSEVVGHTVLLPRVFHHILRPSAMRTLRRRLPLLAGMACCGEPELRRDTMSLIFSPGRKSMSSGRPLRPHILSPCPRVSCRDSSSNASSLPTLIWRRLRESEEWWC